MYTFTKSLDLVSVKAKNARPNQKINLTTLVKEIQESLDYVQETIQEIRKLSLQLYEFQATELEKESVKETISVLKKKLPYFIASGFCPKHHNDATLDYNGNLQLDIDIKQCGGNRKALEIKAHLEALQLPYVLAVFISPSGYGLKIIFATDNKDITKHAMAAEQVITYLSGLLRISSSLFDKLGASQPCFYSYDPNAYINEGTIKEFKITEPQKTATLNLNPQVYTFSPDGKQNNARRAVQFLIDNHIDAASCYNDYLTISAACYKTFGADNSDIAEAILENSAAYRQSNYRKKFFQRWATFKSGTKANAGTLVNLAKKHGFVFANKEKSPNKPKSCYKGIFTEIPPLKEYHLNKYVSEIQDDLLAAILSHDRLQIQGATDIGKTTAIINLITPVYYAKLQKVGIKKIIIPVPRKSLDFTQKIKAQTGINTAFIDGAAEEADIMAALNGNPIVVVTYDSFHKLQSVLGESLVVPDEIQKLVTDNKFRAQVCTNFYELLSLAKKVCIISATPILELCAGSLIKNAPELNYKLIKIRADKRQEKQIQPVYYKGRRCNLLMSHLYGSLKDTTPGRHIILLNDLKELETAKEIIDAQFGAETVAILSAQEPKYSTDSPILKGHILDETKIILCTSFADAGIDFDFEVASIGQFGHIPLSDRAQFLGRPRAKQDLNQNLKIRLYFSLEGKSKGQVIQEFKDAVVFGPKEPIDAIDRFRDELDFTQKTAQRWNGDGLDFTNDFKKAGQASGIAFDWHSKTWKPSIIDIIHKQHKNTETLLTTYGKLYALTFFDDTIEIMEPLFLENNQKHLDAQELLAQKRRMEKEAKENAFKLFCDNIPICLQIVYHTCRNRQIRNKIRALQPQERTMSQEALDLKKLHPKTSAKMLAPALRFLEMMHFCTLMRDMRQQDIPTILLNTIKEKDYQHFKNSIIELWRLNKLQKDKGRDLDAKDLWAAKESRSIRQLMIGRNNLTLTDLKTIYRTAAGNRKISELDLKKRFKELYELKYNKKTRTFIFSKTRTLKDVIEAAKNGKMPPQHDPGEDMPNVLENNDLELAENAKKFIVKE